MEQKTFKKPSDRAYRKSGTLDPGRLQVGPRDPSPGIPKCLGETWDLEPKNIQVGLWIRNPQSGTQDPKILKWNPELPVAYSGYF